MRNDLLSHYTGNRSNNASLLTMLAIGAGIGAIAALMFAPKTGKQMRKTLRRKFEDTRETMGDWRDNANEYFERGSEWANTAKERVTPLVKKMAR